MHVLPKVPKALGRVPGSRAPFALLSLDPPPPPNNNHSAPHRFHHPHTTVTSPYFLHSPDSQCRQFANTLASPVPSFVQCPAPTLLPRPASSSMASRLLQVHSPASLNTLEAQSDPHTPSKMQGQQLCISEFFAADPASPPSSTKQRHYSKRGTKDTCMGMRPPLGLVKYAEFTKEPAVLKWWFAHCSRQEVEAIQGALRFMLGVREGFQAYCPQHPRFLLARMASLGIKECVGLLIPATPRDVLSPAFTMPLLAGPRRRKSRNGTASNESRRSPRSTPST